MKLKKCFQALAALAALLCAGPAFSDEIIGLLADPGEGNGYPFGSAYNGEYQQVYTASAFTGPITIKDLEFFNTQKNEGATLMNSGLWTIALSTTSADWNTLSSTYSENIGVNNTTVFSDDLAQPWTFRNTLHIDLTTPFTYIPGDGNLLMDVLVSGASNVPGGYILFDTNGHNGGKLNGNTIMGRVYDAGGGPTVNNGYGLVTGFSTTAAPVPEPSSMLLLATGLAGILGYGWRRKRAA
jgi:PEP-CTERM motif-containing protein